MDKYDREIISHLLQDGRMSSKAISKMVGFAPATVRRRIRKLLDDGIIRIIGVPNPEKLSPCVTALIALVVSPSNLQATYERVAALPECSLVTLVTGRYDIFILATFDSTSELGKFIKQQLTETPDIERVETFVGMEVRGSPVTYQVS